MQLHEYSVSNYMCGELKEQYMQIIDRLKYARNLLAIADAFGSEPYKFDMSWCIEEFEDAVRGGSMDPGDEDPNINNILSKLTDELKSIAEEMLNKLSNELNI